MVAMAYFVVGAECVSQGCSSFNFGQVRNFVALFIEKFVIVYDVVFHFFALYNGLMYAIIMVLCQ